MSRVRGEWRLCPCRTIVCAVVHLHITSLLRRLKGLAWLCRAFAQFCRLSPICCNWLLSPGGRVKNVWKNQSVGCSCDAVDPSASHGEDWCYNMQRVKVKPSIQNKTTAASVWAFSRYCFDLWYYFVLFSCFCLPFAVNAPFPAQLHFSTNQHSIYTQHHLCWAMHCCHFEDCTSAHLCRNTHANEHKYSTMNPILRQ